MQNNLFFIEENLITVAISMLMKLCEDNYRFLTPQIYLKQIYLKKLETREIHYNKLIHFQNINAFAKINQKIFQIN